MSMTVRPVRLDSEKADLLSILERNLPDLSHARRFEWLYHRNPAGAAWSWFVFEEKSEKPVGVASLFPRYMWVGGSSGKRCGQVGDFAIDAPHRSLGPALLLQKATFDPVNEGALEFCYDCPPDDRGMSTFRRLGMAANCRMHRYARPLRIERQLAARLGNSILSSAAAFLGNFFLSARAWKRGGEDLEIALHLAPFNEEFTALDERIAASDSIRSRRSSVDLNWRFREDPLHEYRVFTARRRGELIGFLVASGRGADTYVVDLFGEPFDQAGPALLHFLAQQERDSKTQSLHALAESGTNHAKVLQRGGFSEREASAHVVAYSRPGTATAEFLARRPQWAFTRMELLA